MSNGSTLGENVFSVNLDELMNMQGHFEDQRRSIGKAHQLKNEVCALSKEGVSLLGKGLLKEAQEKLDRSQSANKQLRELNIPTDVMWELDNDAGQELAELALLISAYPIIVGKTETGLLKFPTDEDLKINPTAYLAGLADAASEITKLAVDLDLNGLAKTETIYRQALYVVQEISQILHTFSRTYPMVLNNTRRRGQGLNNKLRQVLFAELRIKEKLIGLRDRSSLIEEIVSRVGEQVRPTS